ncbi:hypothetical protein M0R04_04950 [Candidatus Dojkabacteria bacterium]|jgi:hypothetical protein|nr:hypothetical protein [Candidatus Dojkabacteria bacterium]
MSKGKWDKFVDEINNRDMKIILADYAQLEKDGYIGECLLRTKAEEWENEINYHSVVLIMRDLAFAAYKRFAELYLKLQESFSKKG